MVRLGDAIEEIPKTAGLSSFATNHRYSLYDAILYMPASM